MMSIYLLNHVRVGTLPNSAPHFPLAATRVAAFLLAAPTLRSTHNAFLLPLFPFQCVLFRASAFVRASIKRAVGYRTRQRFIDINVTITDENKLLIYTIYI